MRTYLYFPFLVLIETIIRVCQHTYGMLTDKLKDVGTMQYTG